MCKGVATRCGRAQSSGKMFPLTRCSNTYGLIAARSKAQTVAEAAGLFTRSLCALGPDRRILEENPTRDHCQESDLSERPLFRQRGIAKKGAAGSWGRAGRARTRSGDGEGWGRDRARVAPVFGSQSVRGCGERHRARFAERDPYIRIGLRLALDEAVTGVRPQHDVVGLVVEDVFALVAFDREHGVAVVVLVAHHSDQQRFARPAR